MKQPATTHLNLPNRVRRLAGMAAARKGQTLTDYVGDLIAADAKETGLDALLVGGDPVEDTNSKEVE